MDKEKTTPCQENRNSVRQTQKDPAAGREGVSNSLNATLLSPTLNNLMAKYEALKKKSLTLKNQLEAETKRANEAEVKAIAMEKDAAAWKKRSVQRRQIIWELTHRLRAAAEFAHEQNAEYGRVCARSYPDLQQLLGNERAGVPSEDQRADLLRAMRRFVADRTLEQDQMEKPFIKKLTDMAQFDAALQNLPVYETRGFMPERQYRLLVEKLLVCLPDGSAETITGQLAACGIEALFYEDVPAEIRSGEYFAIYDSGIDVPALLSRKAGSTEYTVLCRGAHVEKEITDDKGECICE